MNFPKTEEQFLITTSSDQQLELLTSPGQETNPIAIICHPHPLYGGTMTNKVVTTLAKVFSELNYPTIRFNFRGIGKSTGTYGNGIGEIEDLLSVIEWTKKTLPQNKIILAGFSFGGYIAATVATKIFPEKLILVAPSVEHFDMSLLQIPCPWILVQGTEDEVVPAEKVFAWAQTQKIQPVLIEIEGATHFFHGRLIEMREKLLDCLKIK